MFKSSLNPYEEIVAKATDEKQTVEAWDVLLTIWDKVNDDGEDGARNCVIALQKRLQHRSANVQLFSLTLADALVNNCKAALHKEINSRAFTQTLVRLVNDRNTHDVVKKKTLKLIDGWVKDHSNDPNFDLMSDTQESLKSQNHRIAEEYSQPPSGPTDDDRRREEEDMQRAIAESETLSKQTATGYVRSQPPSTSSSALPNRSTPTASTSNYLKSLPQSPSDLGNPTDGPKRPKRVIALYEFDSSTEEELPFKKGEIINVVECAYTEWWRGELRGKIGIFPANYVEDVSDGPMDGAVKEAEAEAQLFSQSAAIDELLIMMRNLEGKNEDIADNDELQELYHQSMSARPGIKKLIDKYNQKQIELRMINDKFSRAESAYRQLTTDPRFDAAQSYGAPTPHYQRQPSQFQQDQQPLQVHPQQLQQQQQAAHEAHQSQPSSDPLAGLSDRQRAEYKAQWDQYYADQREYEAQQRFYAGQHAGRQQFASPQPYQPQDQPSEQSSVNPRADRRLYQDQVEGQQVMPSQQTYQLPHQPPQSLSEEQPRYQLQDEQHRPSVVDQRNHIGGPREPLTPYYQQASPQEQHQLPSTITRVTSQSVPASQQSLSSHPQTQQRYERQQSPPSSFPSPLRQQEAQTHPPIQPTSPAQEPVWNGTAWVYPSSPLSPPNSQTQPQPQAPPSILSSNLTMTDGIGYYLVDPMKAVALAQSQQQQHHDA